MPLFLFISEKEYGFNKLLTLLFLGFFFLQSLTQAKLFDWIKQ